MKKKSRKSKLLFAFSLLLFMVYYNSSHSTGQEEQASGSPAVLIYNRVEFAKTPGDIFINPEYTGEVMTAQAVSQNGESIKLDVEQSEGGWTRVVFPDSSIQEVLVTGRKGSLRVSLYNKKAPAGVNRISSLEDLIIRFGELDATLLTPLTETSNPGGLGVDILDYKKDEFIKGNVIAVTKNQIAVKFQNLPPTVLNQKGTVRVSVKRPDNTFIGGDLRAWGYEIYAPDIDTGKSTPVKAKVFGLPKEAKLRFKFEPISGQDITPAKEVFTVGEINSDEPIATVVTSIPGAQPLSVLVEKVN